MATTSNQDFAARVEAKIDALAKDMNDLREAVGREVGDLRERLAKWPPREDIVTRDVYRADKAGLEARVSALESSPRSTRDNLATYGGCLGQIVFAGLSGVATIIAIASLVYTLAH